jgi:CO/xanthine dehydrogenase Mo-binding subunit
MIVEGQVHGGIAQGIGQALLEHASTIPTGQLLTGSYMDYTMPRADDRAVLQVWAHGDACPGNPLGIKGCGEAGAIECAGRQARGHACNPAAHLGSFGAPARSGRMIIG